MLFNKKVQRACEYCTFGTRIDETMILCSKKGIVSCDHACRKFIYDPCKRIPVKQKASDFSKYNDEDYTL